jgi:FAD synthase
LFKVRDEQRFNSLEELKLQIEKDCDAAKRFFAA